MLILLETKNSYQEITDEELVRQIVVSNNALLFGVLYDRYSHIIYNKCFGFANSDAEAKDLTQDVFVKLFLKLGSYKERAKFSTWLYAFTYNMCVNYVNRDSEKKIARKAVEIKENDQLLIEPDDYNLFQLRIDRLKIALNLISPEEKMILLLKYHDDLSIDDIATVLNIGKSAVKMRLKRAKARVVKVHNEKFNLHG